MARFTAAGCIVLACTCILASNAAQEKSTVEVEEAIPNEEALKNDSTFINIATSTTKNATKRRPGRVVVKYKKVSVKPSSSSNSTSSQNTTELDESVQGNKTRRMKPKSSPQTMIYRPSKNKLIFATSPPTVDLMNEEPTTQKTYDVIQEEPSSTTTTTARLIATTTKPRNYSPSHSTSESPAEHQFDLQMVDSFIRPTARSRIRINKKPVVNNPTDSPVQVVFESAVNRNVVRSRVRSTTTTTTQAPTTTTPKFIRPTRRPSGTRSNMFPNKDQQSQSIDESKEINSNKEEQTQPIKLEEINLPIDDEPSVKIIEAFALPEDVPSVPVIANNNANQPTEDEHLDVEESIRNDETKAADESVSSQPEQEKNASRQRINVPRRKPTTLAPAPESSSEASSFRRNPAAVREQTRIRPSSVVELKPDEDLDEETQLRLQKYEMEKAKQLERLRHNNNNNNRYNSQATIHKTDDDRETTPAVHPIPPTAAFSSSGETGSDFTAQQTPQFSYGTKVPIVRERPNESPKLIRPEVKLKEAEKVARLTSTPVYPAVPQRKPEVIYTPPLREFQPPASFHSPSAERTTQPIRLVYYSAQNEKEGANILPPPVTYEPPHADYQPPSPAPPPRIYVPPTEEFKPPTSGLVIRRRPAEASSSSRQRPAENVRMVKGLTDSYTRLVAVGKPAVGNNNNLPYPPGQVLTDDDHQLYIISTEPVQIVRQQQKGPASYTQEQNDNNGKAIKEGIALYAQQQYDQSYRETENVKKTPKLVRVIKKPLRAHHALPAAAAVKVQSTTPAEIPIRSSGEKPLESYRLANYESNFDRDQQSQSEPLYASSYVEPPAPAKVLHYLKLQQVSDDQRHQPYVVSSERPLDEVIEYIERPLRENNEHIEDQTAERPPQGNLFSPSDPVIYHRPHHQSTADDSSIANVELSESIGFVYDPRPEKVERTRSPEQQFLQQRPRDQPLRQEPSIISNSDSLSNNRPYEGRAVEINRQPPPDFFQLPPPLKNPFESSEAVRAATEFIHPFSDDFWSVNPEPLIQYDQRQQPPQQQQPQYYQPPTTTPRFISRPKLQVAHTSDQLTYYQTPFVYQEHQQQQGRFNRSLEDDSPSTLFYQDYSRPEPDRSNRARQIAPARAVVSESSGSSAGRGVPGVDYPTLEFIPDDLRFSCESVGAPGYYADPDTRCQVFHVCQMNPQRVKDSFLCPNGTIFNQKVRVCDWWHNVKCGDSESFYHVNSDSLDDQPRIASVTNAH